MFQKAISVKEIELKPEQIGPITDILKYVKSGDLPMVSALFKHHVIIDPMYVKGLDETFKIED